MIKKPKLQQTYLRFQVRKIIPGVPTPERMKPKKYTQTKLPLSGKKKTFKAPTYKKANSYKQLNFAWHPWHH